MLNKILLNLKEQGEQNLLRAPWKPSFPELRQLPPEPRPGGLPKSGSVPRTEGGTSPEPWRKKGGHPPLLLGQLSATGNAEPELTSLMQSDVPEKYFFS